MSQDVFLYTLPQWFIFSAITVIAYGWIENKKPFRLVGLFVLIALGLFALYAILKGYFIFSKYLTPEEMLSEELDGELVENIPFSAKLLPAYWSFIVSAVLAIPALYFDWKNKKPTRLFMILAGLVSLYGFFVIVDALKFI